MMIEAEADMTGRESRFDGPMILFLHNRYRTTGGEERVVDDLRWLVSEHLGEHTELLQRDSGATGKAQAAVGLLRGGLRPAQVTERLRSTGARVLHAHNLHPTLGWRSLAAARGCGARVVMHLHQYRLVCATGVCFTEGEECTRCHGRNTMPGVAQNCRGSRAEAVSYAAALALYQRRLIDQVDAFILPSVFARERLRSLGAPLPWDRVHVLPPPVRAVGAHAAEGAATGEYALVVSRLAREKGVDIAIRACQIARMPLLIAGEGPELGGLRELAGGGDVRFLGAVQPARLELLRDEATMALVPSLSAETFGMAAAEAMAHGLPVAASDIGALPEIVEPEGLVPAGDAEALARAIEHLRSDTAIGERGRRRIGEMCAPETVAGALAAIYAPDSES
jgi:glycosyltransferase involved in cell wall biosynthesis